MGISDVIQQFDVLVGGIHRAKPELAFNKSMIVYAPFEMDVSYILVAKDYGLPVSVINVLIYYYILLSRDKVSTLDAAFTKIAWEWSKNNVDTVDDAIKMIEYEHSNYETYVINSQRDKQIASKLRRAVASGVSDQELGKYVKLLLQQNEI
ncbi:hypothetical protein COL60_26990 [Bacillus pseudomycoides]|uniref:DnaD domain protein n=1 Tax=Bacillus pseudomycoides TaxID=64104 RepID=UPI000BF6035F|nr:DnaD domain protein [Bacillus pseudomycoides]PFZ02728.1 hypothetical protein COL60_26990 [Bacillus pseudomycoides]